MKKLIALTLLSLFSITTWAEMKSVTLAVPGMDCPVCPVTVRKALKKVGGVLEVTVDLESRTATVDYDDGTVDPHTLTQATTDAGFPSTISGK